MGEEDRETALVETGEESSGQWENSDRKIVEIQIERAARLKSSNQRGDALQLRK